MYNCNRHRDWGNRAQSMIQHNSPKQLIYEKISSPDLSNILFSLPKTGNVKQAHSGLIYLDIDNRYINDIFDMLRHYDLEKPDYFSIKTEEIGAHISIAYPNEKVPENIKFIGELQPFSVELIFSTNLNDVRYFALKVQSASLQAIRNELGLPNKLQLDNFLVDFHITVAKQFL